MLQIKIEREKNQMSITNFCVSNSLIVKRHMTVAITAILDTKIEIKVLKRYSVKYWRYIDICL